MEEKLSDNIFVQEGKQGIDPIMGGSQQSPKKTSNAANSKQNAKIASFDKTEVASGPVEELKEGDDDGDKSTRKIARAEIMKK